MTVTTSDNWRWLSKFLHVLPSDGATTDIDETPKTQAGHKQTKALDYTYVLVLVNGEYT